MDGRFRPSRATVAITIFLTVLLLAISVGSLAAAEHSASSNADTEDAGHEHDWPMYRYDTQDRDGHNPTANPPTKAITEDWSVGIYDNEHSPIVYEGNVYVVTDVGTVQARSPDTGELIWEKRVGENPTRAVGTHGQIIVGASGLSSSYSNLVSDDPHTGERNWHRANVAPSFTAGVAVSNPYFVCVEGPNTYDYRIDIRDGTEARSCADEGGDLYGIEDSTRVDGIEYATTETRSRTEKLAAFTIQGGRDYYDPEWEFSLGIDNREATHTSEVTIAGDVALVWADNDEYGSGIHAINRHTGEHLWHYPTPEEIIGEPIVSDGNVYFTTPHQLYKLSGDTTQLSNTEPTPEPTSTSQQPTRPPESTDAPIPTPDPQPTPEPTDTATRPPESTDAPIPTPDIPSPEPTTGSETPDSTDGQAPAQTPDSSITFPDATQPPTSTPSDGADESPAQTEADLGISLPDPSPATSGTNTSTTGRENSPDSPTNSRTETQPTTANQGAVTAGTDASATETPAADSAVSDGDSDASAPPAGSTATAPDSETNMATDDSTPISTESPIEDQAGFGPLVALLAVVGSILIAYRRT